MRLGKLTIGRKGYWIATAVLLAVQWFGPKNLGVALLAPWMILYTARLRDSGRSAFHLLHLAAVLAIIFTPIFVAPQAFEAYMGDTASSQTPPLRDTLVFLACIIGGMVYYVAFSIWLGCIKTKTTANAVVLSDTFS